MELKNIVKEYKISGVLDINIPEIISKWNHLWYLSEYRDKDDWKLIKYIRKDSATRDIKISISKENAKILINKLGLVSESSSFFRNAFSWRKQKDIDALDKWRSIKNNKSIK